MPTDVIERPDGEKLAKDADALAKYYDEFVVETEEDYRLAAEEAVELNQKIAALEAKKEALTKPMNEALRQVRALFAGPLERLESAKRAFSGKLLAYRRAQEAKARVEEARRQAEAEAERKRREAEAQRLRDEQMERENAAIEAAEKGNLQRAEQLNIEAAEIGAHAQATETIAAVTAAMPVARSTPKVAGVQSAKSLEFEVTDTLALVEWIVKTVRSDAPQVFDPMSIVEIKTAALRSLVKISGVNSKIPGVRVWEGEQMRFSRGGAR